MVVAGSDCWVGSIVVTLYDYTSGGASVILVFSDGDLSCMYFRSVSCSDATYVCNYSTAATSFV